MAKYGKVLIYIFVYNIATIGCSKLTSYSSWNGDNDNNAAKICPDGQSLLSSNDVIEIIEYIADKLNLKDNIINSYYFKLVDLNNKYMNEIKEFHDKLEDRPKHVKHILEDMENKRQEIEPVVKLVVTKMEEIEINFENFTIAAERSNKLLARFEMYKGICQMNCQDSQFDERNGHSENNIIPLRYSSNTFCYQIKDLYNTITQQLTDFEKETTADISHNFENADEILRNCILSHKDELKNAAVQRFGLIMYDILSLQDDYHHFVKYVNNVHESLESVYLHENISKIVQTVEFLEKDVDNYGLHCMNCHNKILSKRDISSTHFLDTNEEYDYYEERDYTEKHYYTEEYNYIEEHDYTEELDYTEEHDNTDETLDERSIDDLINIKIEEITGIISNNISNIFEELMEYLNDFESINEYIGTLLPIGEVVNDVEIGQKALDALKNQMPESSLDKLTKLLLKSADILANLAKSKEYLDSVLT